MLRTTMTMPLFLVLLVACAASAGAQDENPVYTITRPQRSLDAIEKTYADMRQVAYEPPADRWQFLPITRRKLSDGGELRILMLGDSIVNDTSRSCFDLLVAKSHPQTRVTKITVVRGSTGCWWYREDGRVKQHVLAHRPDLLIIGGISQRDDIDAIREVIRQVRQEQNPDVLLMTGAFGRVDPNDDSQWSFDIPDDAKNYRARLQALAKEQKCGFLDMTAHWGKYIRDSAEPLDAFKRDVVHANERGEQILGRILARHLRVKGC